MCKSVARSLSCPSFCMARHHSDKETDFLFFDTTEFFRSANRGSGGSHRYCTLSAVSPRAGLKERIVTPFQ
jgi:hypothetical protein